MRAAPHSRTGLWLAVTALVACAGQSLLVRSGEAWTLFPGCALLLCGAILLSRLAPASPGPPVGPGLTPSQERWSFLAVMAVAVFFRVHQLGSVPVNLYVECANVGLGGLRILHEGWRPFYETWFFENPALMLYLSALWFKVFPPTQVHLGLFYAAYSLAAFPFVYWTFRQLAGPAMALTTLFILAVMRTQVFYSRWGHSMVQPALYLFATLAFGLHAFRTGKRWAFWAGAASFSLGLYTYQNFKLVPLLLAAFLVFEYRKNRAGFLKALPSLGWALAGSVVLVLPLLVHWIGQGTLGARESGLFIGRSMMEEGSPKALLDNLVGMALMFNRSGSPDPLINLPGHRWFDDVTGVLWVLGLGLALRSWKERAAFTTLVALGILGLADLLTVEPLNIGRLLPALPFLAFLAAWALLQAGAILWKAAGPAGWVLVPGWAVLLGAMAWQNYTVHFLEQARDPRHLTSNDALPTRLAREVRDKGDAEPFYLCARYQGHSTLCFLNYFHPDRWHVLGPPEAPLPGTASRGQAVHIVLDEGKTGYLRYLADRYPGSQAQTWLSPDGTKRAYDLRVPSAALSGPGAGKASRGLWAIYWAGPGREAVLSRREPLVNFTFRGDFPVVGEDFDARWEGRFRVEEAGAYGFFLLQHSGDEADLFVDGRPVEGAGKGREGVLVLEEGWHRLKLVLHKRVGFFAALNLLWRPPGQAGYEVMPNRVFGMGDPPPREGRP